MTIGLPILLEMFLKSDPKAAEFTKSGQRHLISRSETYEFKKYIHLKSEKVGLMGKALSSDQKVLVSLVRWFRDGPTDPLDEFLEK